MSYKRFKWIQNVQQKEFLKPPLIKWPKDVKEEEVPQNMKLNTPNHDRWTFTQAVSIIKDFCNMIPQMVTPTKLFLISEVQPRLCPDEACSNF